jgi:hypothetical protein
MKGILVELERAGPKTVYGSVDWLIYAASGGSKAPLVKASQDIQGAQNWQSTLSSFQRCVQDVYKSAYANHWDLLIRCGLCFFAPKVGLDTHILTQKAHLTGPVCRGRKRNQSFDWLRRS